MITPIKQAIQTNTIKATLVALISLFFLGMITPTFAQGTTTQAESSVNFGSDGFAEVFGKITLTDVRTSKEAHTQLVQAAQNISQAAEVINQNHLKTWTYISNLEKEQQRLREKVIAYEETLNRLNRSLIETQKRVQQVNLNIQNTPSATAE